MKRTYKGYTSWPSPIYWDNIKPKYLQLADTSEIYMENLHKYQVIITVETKEINKETNK